jgi:hypothetical protein
MSELESRFVKKGYWVNLSQGSIMGQTITTDAKTGSIIVALLAVITSLGMTHLWHLLTFFFHQSRANGRPRDGLFRHQQAILRTLPTPSSMMADSVKLWYAWRGVSDRALGRSLAHISVAFLFAAASLMVSIYSSSIVDNTNLEVLVQSPHCGRIGFSDGSFPDWNAYFSAVFSAAKDYTPDCYKDGSLPIKCNVFSRPKIDFKTEVVPCPFDDKMCSSPAIEFDSGLVDLNDALGMNLRDSDRIQYRRKNTCTILPLEGYTRVTPAYSETSGSPLLPEEEVVEYLYGGADYNNYTYAVNGSYAQTDMFDKM